jgi:hypothetical protein
VGRASSLAKEPYSTAEDAEDGRGGSGGGNGGTVPRTGSRGIGRVGPSVSKITRARKEKRPGTSGRGRNPEGEASKRDSFRRNPLMGRLQNGFGP